MKNQWFGDIKDYYKYGLLRLITKYTGLKVGVCWMLTQDDGRKRDTKYLCKPEIWRRYDPPLYDFLRHHALERNVRDIAKIENPQILPGCWFHSETLRDDTEARQQYFSDFRRLVQACDLLFFDADTGMEVKSHRYGHKHSSKYLYWREVREFYNLGYSLLIFQYHRHVNYEDFISSLSDEFVTNVRVRPLCSYRTKSVTLLLLAQSRHRAVFRELNEAMGRHWQGEIQVISNQ